MKNYEISFTHKMKVAHREELEEFITATGIAPLAVFERVLDEVRTLLNSEVILEEIMAELRGEDVIVPILDRTGGSFKYHVGFQSEMLSDNPLPIYENYMRQWIGGELFWRYREQYELLTKPYQGVQSLND